MGASGSLRPTSSKEELLPYHTIPYPVVDSAKFRNLHHCETRNNLSPTTITTSMVEKDSPNKEFLKIEDKENGGDT
eukprot:6159965-Pleurochrysis_carterae.AAC.1